ncbi:MAG: hypothetical protein RIS60_753, partial [Pseudomonadota bacterium]
MGFGGVFLSAASAGLLQAVKLASYENQ